MENYSKLCTWIHPTNKSNAKYQNTIGITVHHMAGNLTKKQMENIIDNPARLMSCNYAIYSDGTIEGFCPENRRSWCTSSEWNDQRRITIEVANNSGEPYWTVSDQAYKSLIKLCQDICERYNINPYWDGTIYAPLTIHKQFAATACPGPYLEQIITSGQLARDIKAGEANVKPDQYLTLDSKVVFYETKIDAVDAKKDWIHSSLYGGWIGAEIFTETTADDGNNDQIIHVGSVGKIEGEYTVSGIMAGTNNVYLKELGFWVNANGLEEVRDGR